MELFSFTVSLLNFFSVYTDSIHPIVDTIATKLGYSEKRYGAVSYKIKMKKKTNFFFNNDLFYFALGN